VQIHDAKDFYSGLLFIAIGLAFAIGAANYPLGSAVRMGAGYFPLILGGLMAVLGLIITVSSLRATNKDEGIGAFAFTPLLLILGAIVLFGVLVQPLGLIPATVLLVVVGALGGGEFRLKEVAILAVVLVAMAVGIFYYGLGLPFHLWPEF
jgi:Tripartite tricarboxylate transporter TctB family